MRTRPSQVWKDPDYYRRGYGETLQRFGLDPSVVNDDRVLESIFAFKNSLGPEDFSAFENAAVTGRQLPDHLMSGLRNALLSSSLPPGAVTTPPVAPPALVTAAPDPSGSAYVANPRKLEEAVIGGTPALPASGGLTTASVDAPLPAAASAPAAVLDDPWGAPTLPPKLTAALETGAALADNPKGDLRQLPRSNARATPAPSSSPDAAVAQVRQQRRAAVPVNEADLGYLAADLGIGDWITRRGAAAAAAMHPTGPAGHTLKTALAGGSRALGLGVKALPYVAAVAPAVTAAIEGSQSGAGGAAIQGGAAGIGTALGGAAGFALGGPLGAAIGMGLGGSIGNAVGGMGRNAAVSAVEAAQGGATGLSGQIGRSLDAVIDTPMEQESRQIVAQMNSPAVLALKAEEQRRSSAERARMAQDLLMQIYARGIA